METTFSKDAEYVSRKCRALSFLAAVAVVVIHSDATLTLTDLARWNVFLQKLCCQRFTQWAVPLFFMFSGYWFLKGSYARGRQRLVSFYQGKAFSLLMPYIVFAIVGSFLVLPLVIFNNYTHSRHLFAFTFLHGGVIESLDSLLGVSGPHPLMYGSLWYVKTLMVLFLFAPIWVAVRRKPFIFLLVGLFVFVLSVFAKGWPFWIGTSYFFFIGCYFGCHSRLVANYSIGIAGQAVLIALFASMVLAINDAGYIRIGNCGKLALENVSAIAWILGIWVLYDYMDCISFDKFCQYGKLSFWIYCIHMIFAQYVKSGWRYVFGISDISVVLIPFINAVIVLALSILSGSYLNRYFPRVFKFLTGGR